MAAAGSSEHGPLTMLVNNAGVGMTGPFSDMTAEDWAFIRSINLDGVVNCCSAFTPPMLAARPGPGRQHLVRLGFTPDGRRVGLRRHQGGRPPPLPVPAGRLGRPRGRRDRHLPRLHQHAHRQATRFTGGRRIPGTRERMVRGFQRGHPPEKVGAAVVDAIAANRAVVPVGFESVLGLVRPPPARPSPSSRPSPAWAAGAEERHALPPPPREPSRPPGRLAWRPPSSAGPRPTAGPHAARRRPADAGSADGEPPSQDLGWGELGSPGGAGVPTPDGASLAVWDIGTGPTVVLPHCWGCSHAVWVPVARRLVESGHRVVLYDQRGHGATTRGTAPLSIETLADDLAAVLEAWTSPTPSWPDIPWAA